MLGTLTEMDHWITLWLLTHFLVCNATNCNSPQVTCSDSDLVKIHWHLNGLHQDDPNLIEAIKSILIPPDSLPLSILSEPSRKRLMGQFNQVRASKIFFQHKKVKVYLALCRFRS